MLVLKILGIIAVIITILIIIKAINSHTLQTYRYQFFNVGNMILSAIAYWSIFFGYKWYTTALTNNADTLNGLVLIILGITILLAILIYNITKTSFVFGLFVGIFQIILYIPVSVLVLIFVILFIAWASETKPVYVWNN